MPCTGRYSEAWEFAAFWCVGPILTGVDNSGGGPNAFLTDTLVNFERMGAEAGHGMLLYNTTTGLSGAITAVEPNALTATGVTWTDGDAYRTVLIRAEERSTIEHYLNVAASDLYAAMAATGMCDCSLADWASDYLSKLNVIDAAAYYECPCGAPAMSDERKNKFLDWMSQQLMNIRTGAIDLCDGATGSDFPAIAHAERGWTAQNTALIIFNRILREG